MDGGLDGLPFVKAYLDEVVVFSKTMTEKMEHIERVITLVARLRLKIKVSKCDFCKVSVPFFGDIVDQNGVCIALGKVDVIKKTPTLCQSSKTQILFWHSKILLSFHLRTCQQFCLTSYGDFFESKIEVDERDGNGISETQRKNDVTTSSCIPRF